MEDHLIIATAADDSIRIYCALTTGVVEEARKIHGTWLQLRLHLEES